MLLRNEITKESRTWKTRRRAERSFANGWPFRRKSDRRKNRLRNSPKGGPAKRVPPQSARSVPEVSARSVSETNGMAFAARWQIVIRRLSRQLSHPLAFSSARLTHVTSLGWQAIPMFEQPKFSPLSAHTVH